jgi:hypothetical protein
VHDWLRYTYRALLYCRKSLEALEGKAKLRVLGRARVGRSLCIAGPLRVRVSPGGRLLIGDHVRLVSGFLYNPVGHDSVNAFWVGPRGVLEIQDRAGLSSTTIACNERVTIGAGAFIGGGTKIFDNDFHSLDPNIRVHGPDDQVRTKPVTIGRECFVGGYCIVLKGVTIGEQSVVGAGSVVVRDIPPRQIWGGNPAVFLREL